MIQRRGKAVLVITHDDRYFDLADRCIRLDYGQVVPNPPHRSRPVAQLLGATPES